MVANALCLLLLSTLLATLTGCATTGYNRADATGDVLQSAKDAFLTVSDSIDSAVNSLNVLLMKEEGDLAPTFRKFSRDVNDLKVNAERATRLADSARAHQEAYLDHWRQQSRAIENSDIATMSQDKLARMRDDYNMLNEDLAKARRSYDSLIVELSDVQKYLSISLTSAAVDEIRSQAQMAIDRADEAKNDVQSAIESLNEVSERLSTRAGEKQTPSSSSIDRTQQPGQ